MVDKDVSDKGPLGIGLGRGAGNAGGGGIWRTYDESCGAQLVFQKPNSRFLWGAV